MDLVLFFLLGGLEEFCLLAELMLSSVGIGKGVAVFGLLCLQGQTGQTNDVLKAYLSNAG